MNYKLFDDELAGTLEHFVQWIAAPENRDYQIRQIAGAADLHRARQVILEHFFFIGLTESYEESLDALALLSPLPINTRVPVPRRKKRSELFNKASDNSISRSLLENPDTRGLLEAANRHDSELYQWVKRELYPQYLARARRAESRPAPPVSSFDRSRSKFFNNVIYATAQRARYRINNLPGDEQPVW